MFSLTESLKIVNKHTLEQVESIKNYMNLQMDDIDLNTQINVFVKNKKIVEEEIRKILESNNVNPQGVPHNTIIMIELMISFAIFSLISE